MALSTLASVKTHLSIVDTSQDTLLTQLLTQADAMIKTWCRQALEQATYTEYYDAPNTNRLVLRQHPVYSIASLYYDAKGNYGYTSGAFASTNLLTSGVEYTLAVDQPDGSSRSGIVQRIGGVWSVSADWTIGWLAAGVTSTKGAVKITYTAGYASPLPNDLVLACNQAVGTLYRLRSIGYESKGVADQKEQVMAPLQQMLAPFRNIRF